MYTRLPHRARSSLKTAWAAFQPPGGLTKNQSVFASYTTSNLSTVLSPNERNSGRTGSCMAASLRFRTAFPASSPKEAPPATRCVFLFMPYKKRIYLHAYCIRNLRIYICNLRIYIRSLRFYIRSLRIQFLLCGTKEKKTIKPVLSGMFLRKGYARSQKLQRIRLSAGKMLFRVTFSLS